MRSTENSQEAHRKPIFVLHTGRSGSTLLRFILDSHPEIACPPETNVALACKYLANTWQVLKYAQPENVHDAGSSTSDAEHAYEAIRKAIDAAFSGYLQSVGKVRWCDKSPDAIWDAEILARLYPEA